MSTEIRKGSKQFCPHQEVCLHQDGWGKAFKQLLSQDRAGAVSIVRRWVCHAGDVFDPEILLLDNAHLTEVAVAIRRRALESRTYKLHLVRAAVLEAQAETLKAIQGLEGLEEGTPGSLHDALGLLESALTLPPLFDIKRSE